jgi:hypothetical protein
MFINNITSNSPYLTVQTYQGNKPYISPGSQSAGMLRLNTNTQQVEVYDGMSWMTLGGGYSTIELSPVVQTAINWVMEQMAKESKMKEMAQKHASVQAALDNVEQAKRELDLIYELAKDHTK